MGYALRNGIRRGLNIPKRVEILNGSLKFLSKKLRHVGKARAPAADEDPHRRGAALRGAIEIDRTGDLRMETGHGIPSDLGEAGFGGVFGFGISSAKSHRGFLEFEFFSERYFLREFLGDRRADGITPDGDAATEEAVIFDEDEVCRAGPKIQQERAAFGISIIVAEGVEKSGWCEVDFSRSDASLADGIDDFVKLIRLHGDDRNIPSLASAIAHYLIIPDDLIDRKRHILLGLESYD